MPFGTESVNPTVQGPLAVARHPDRGAASMRRLRSPVIADAFLADAARSGVFTPPPRAGSGPPPKPAPVARLDEVLAELDERRRDR